jgi:hypothetical protein
LTEVLKETVANRFLPTICRKTNAREADQGYFIMRLWFNPRRFGQLAVAQ